MKKVIKQTIKIIIEMLIVFIILGVVSSIIITKRIRPVIYKYVEEKLNRTISIGTINVKFPVSISINDIKLSNEIGGRSEGDFISVKRLRLSPDLMSLFSGRLVVRSIEIERPVIRLERYKKKEYNFTGMTDNYKQSGYITDNGVRTNIEQPLVKKKKKQSSFSVLISKFRIKQGRLEFLDRKNNKDGTLIVLENINAEIKGAVFPTSSVTINFDIGMNVNDNIGALMLKGWLNPFKKNMRLDFKLSDIDVVNFKDYYQKFSSQDVISGNLSFYSLVDMKKGIFTADNQLDIVGVRFAEQSKEKDIRGSIFGISALDFVKSLTNSRGEVQMDFVLKGNINDSDFSLKKLLIGAFVDNLRKNITKSISNIIFQLSEKSAGGVKDSLDGINVDRVKKMGDDLEQAGKELHNTFKGIFGDIIGQMDSKDSKQKQ